MSDSDIPPAPRRLPQPRNGGRTPLRSPNNQPERDAWAAARWINDGWTLREIADALELKSKSAAHDSVQRGLRTTREPLEADAERARAAHRARLGYALEVATEVMGRDHVHVSQGRIMVGDNGNPLIDDGPKLAAAGKVKELSESLRKLDGLDAPQSAEVSLVNLDRAIADAERRLAAAENQTGQTPAAEGTEG